MPDVPRGGEAGCAQPGCRAATQAAIAASDKIIFPRGKVMAILPTSCRSAFGARPWSRVAWSPISMQIAGGRGFTHACHRLPALLGGDAILFGEGEQALARKLGV